MPFGRNHTGAAAAANLLPVKVTRHGSQNYPGDGPLVI